MASTAEDIATAAKARLDAISGTLSAPYTTVLDLDGKSAPSAITSTAIVVITPLGSQRWERAGRGSSKTKDVGLVLAIKRRESAEATLSGFLELAEEIHSDLSQQRLAGYAWQSMEFDEPFDIENFQQSGVASLTAELEYRGVS